MSDLYTNRFFDRVDTRAETAAKESRLPGWQSGPADAFRHIVASAEMTRRHSSAAAWLLGEANEQKGNFVNRQDKDDLAMDRHNNAIGPQIGRDAKSFEEILERAKSAITEGVAHDGSGAADREGRATPIWLSRKRWGEDDDEQRDRSNWPPGWKASEGPQAQRVLARPVEDWTQDDVHAVQRSKLYLRGDGPERAAAFAKVRRWYERDGGSAPRAKSGGGPVAVRAYVRDDGTQVAGHSRAAPR
ncbi:MAG: hypothetical protein JNL71_19425 [Rhodospirillales bacterium]|nr:hypothetical protein [Rhodospirillales bacterium]